MLAFDSLMVVGVLDLDEAQQGRTQPSLIRFWLMALVKLSSRDACRRKARIFVPQAALRWWRLFR